MSRSHLPFSLGWLESVIILLFIGGMLGVFWKMKHTAPATSNPPQTNTTSPKDSTNTSRDLVSSEVLQDTLVYANASDNSRDLAAATASDGLSSLEEVSATQAQTRTISAGTSRRDIENVMATEDEAGNLVVHAQSATTAAAENQKNTENSLDNLLTDATPTKPTTAKNTPTKPATVRAMPAAPANPGTNTRQMSANTGSSAAHYLIAGSSKTLADAQKQAENLKKQGLNATVLPLKDGVYRISVFHSSDRKKVEEYKAKKGLNGAWIFN